MAELRKIVKSNPVSNFRQSAPEAGGAFRFLAAAAEEAYNFLKPAAVKEMEERGMALGSEIAKQQISDPKAALAVSSMGGTADIGGGISPEAETAFRTLEGTWGRPLRVNSAYRDPKKNAAVGGAKGSQHIHGNAFDVDVSDLSQEERVNLIKSARASGFRGIGVYNNSLHFDVGGDRAWGPSYGRESLPSWAADAVGAPVGGGAVVTASSSGSAYTPTMLREADGKLTARLYSPMAGELLQVSNAAAGVAYTSEVMLKGMTDLMGMSEQFLLDPEGFDQAARAYVDDMVKASPEMFRGDIRASLEKEVGRRFLGIMEDRQRDIRQRADNSSRALMDRWSGDLAAAIAGGNPEEIEAARTELGSVLRARESLPGAAWTPEQSYNVMLKAEEEGRRLIEKGQTDQQKAWKESLSLITKAAGDFMTAADETILQNPIVAAMLPEEWREAAATVALRDNMSFFLKMTPAQHAAFLAEMKEQPVSEEWQMDIYSAAETVAADNAKAWEDDPIKRAGEVLDQKPPVIPEIDPSNPKAFIDALAARSAYAEGLVAQGYIAKPALLSDTEAEAFGAMLGKETPPELRALMAGAVVSGLGDRAASFFKEIKTTDPVLRIAGQLMARGGDGNVATAMMQGQAMLDQGLVSAPTKATSIGSISGDIATALAGLPAAIQNQGDIIAAATALYAVNARGVDPSSDAAKDLMEQAVQTSLGQSQKRGVITGGVQNIGGNPVLLPPGMAGEDLNSALEAAVSGDTSGLGFFERLALPFSGVEPRNIWPGGVAPMLEGEPLNPQYLRDGLIMLTPVGGSNYRLSVKGGDGVFTDARMPDGMSAYVFDAQKLIDAARGIK